jgi:hypothetical protein
MSWLRKLLRPPAEEQERKVILEDAQKAVDSATETVAASVKARRRVLELQLELRRRPR